MPAFPDDADDFLAKLQEALEEPSHVPHSVVQAGYGAFAWRNIDAELAELAYDSFDHLAEAGVRSQAAELRSLTFVSASLTVELELEEDRWMGQLVPPQPATITLLVQDAPAIMLDADDLGCFLIEPTPKGPFRLRVVGEHTVDTNWITL